MSALHVAFAALSLFASMSAGAREALSLSFSSFNGTTPVAGVLALAPAVEGGGAKRFNTPSHSGNRGGGGGGGGGGGAGTGAAVLAGTDDGRITGGTRGFFGGRSSSTVGGLSTVGFGTRLAGGGLSPGDGLWGRCGARAGGAAAAVSPATSAVSASSPLGGRLSSRRRAAATSSAAAHAALSRTRALACQEGEGQGRGGGAGTHSKESGDYRCPGTRTRWVGRVGRSSRERARRGGLAGAGSRQTVLVSSW